MFHKYFIKQTNKALKLYLADAIETFQTHVLQ